MRTSGILYHLPYLCGRSDLQLPQGDIVFDVLGDSPHELIPGRFYRGTVNGYADFGVFVDLSPGVTGLLHRSQLDQRLESLEWEPGDDVFVQLNIAGAFERIPRDIAPQDDKRKTANNANTASVSSERY